MSLSSTAVGAPLPLPDGGVLRADFLATTHDPANTCVSLKQATTTPAIPRECTCLTSENHESFRRIYAQRQLHAVFQPILDYRQHRYTGFEGLIRGPADTPLHAPQTLFCLAQACGMGSEFELLCREIVLSAFARLNLPGRLFLNVSASCLVDPRFINGHTQKLLQELGLRPGRIVIEITENQKITDFDALQAVLKRHRAAGYQFAIDDLGEGFANLRMWSEIRPEFVKIDKHFIRGIADDPLKFRLVQAMRDIAENTHSELIAEGIETESEFCTLRDLGISHGQGFLIARPTAEPALRPHDDVFSLLRRSQLIVFPQRTLHKSSAARELLETVDPLPPWMTNDKALEIFESQPQRMVLPIVHDSGKVVGVINRHSLIDRFARPFRRELYGRKPCTQFMNADPIQVDHATSIHELGQIFARAENHQLADGFVITENGRYLGMGSSQALMKLITEMQMRAARYANPLTQLPGNVPINEHIDRLLANGAPFVACYCDVDYFKPYNDCYGYRQGDQIITTLGAILIRHCSERFDFVGHVGGDDFVILFQSPDWETRCRAILDDFAASVSAFVAAEHYREGGYQAEDRRGNIIFHPLPSLSIGAVVIEPQCFPSHREVSGVVANAKKQAKQMPGNALFVERRRQ